MRSQFLKPSKIHVLVFTLLFTCCLIAAVFAYRTISLLFVIPSAQSPIIHPPLVLQQSWCVSPGLIATQVTLSEGFLYVRTPNEIVALRRKTGEIIWTSQVHDDASRVPPTLALNDNSLLVVSRATSSLVLLDATTGQQKWSISEKLAGDTFANSISMGAANAYITWQNYGLVAYEIRTGIALWKIPYDKARVFAISVADEFDNVYVAESKKITAYDGNGKELWVFEGGTVVRGLTRHHETLYFYQDEHIKALDTTDASVKWEFSFAGEFPMRFYGDELFAASSNGKLAAINLNTGDELWTTQLPTDSPLQTPAIFGGKVYVESLDDGQVYVVDQLTGQKVGQIDVAAQISEPNLSFGLGPKSDGEMLLIPSGSILCAYS